MARKAKSPETPAAPIAAVETPVSPEVLAVVNSNGAIEATPAAPAKVEPPVFSAKDILAKVKAAKSAEPTPVATEATAVADDDTEIEIAGDDDASAGQPASTTTTKEPKAPKWIDDTVRQMAAVYGIEDDELADYASRDEFNRTVGVAHKQWAAAQQQIEQAGRTQQPQPTQPEPAKAANPETPWLKADGSYNIDYLKEQGASDLEIAIAMDVQQTKLNQARIMANQQQQAFQQAAGRFDELVDRLDMPALFGKKFNDKGEFVTISRKAAINRQELLNEIEIAKEVIARRQYAAGQSIMIPPEHELLKKALGLRFGEEVGDLKRAARREKAKVQAKDVRPNFDNANSASGAHAVAHAAKPTSAAAIARLPEVRAKMAKFREENGLN